MVGQTGNGSPVVAAGSLALGPWAEPRPLLPSMGLTVPSAAELQHQWETPPATRPALATAPVLSPALLGSPGRVSYSEGTQPVCRPALDLPLAPQPHWQGPGGVQSMLDAGPGPSRAW